MSNKFKVSKGLIFTFNPNIPLDERIYILGFTDQWTSGGYYITKEEAEELKTKLEQVLKMKNTVIF